MVFSGLVTAWRLAGWPTRRSPSSVKATIEGVVRMPSEFSMTLGAEPSITATQELVVPRSIPITLPMGFLSFLATAGRPGPDGARTEACTDAWTLVRPPEITRQTPPPRRVLPHIGGPCGAARRLITNPRGSGAARGVNGAENLTTASQEPQRLLMRPLPLRKRAPPHFGKTDWETAENPVLPSPAREKRAITAPAPLLTRQCIAAPNPPARSSSASPRKRSGSVASPRPDGRPRR